MFLHNQGATQEQKQHHRLLQNIRIYRMQRERERAKNTQEEQYNITRQPTAQLTSAATVLV